MRRTFGGRSRGGEASGPVSLFPFLAVLICTMGSLILLLVVIARQARLQAAEPTDPDHDQLRAELDGELEINRFLASELDQSHQQTETDLQQARLRLGHLEEHSAELKRQLADLQAAWAQLEAAGSGTAAGRRAAEAQLAALAVEISQMTDEIENARMATAGREPSYSIVPYEGPNGTHRRPIYLECRAEGVVLQPEGILFPEDDFLGPLDAGNPLDAALRMVREYLTSQQATLGPSDRAEPYPLLLVRPSGIKYYYATRAAMKSWGSEFGYELVGDDWQLDFPPPDPVLARSIAAVVQPARERQRLVIAAAPSRYGRGSDRPVYTVRSARGGPTRLTGTGDGRQPDFGNGNQPGKSGPFGPAGSPTVTSTPGGSSDGTSSTAGASGSPSGQSQAVGQNAQASAPGQNAQAAQSLAKTRGRNWGLPDATRSAVAIMRPVRVECHADRLIVVPERGLGNPKTVYLGAAVAPSIDELVSTVWDYIETWGKAGTRMYWRPKLKVYLAPDAEPRLAELEALLEDSGLLIENAGRLTTQR